jgi:pimeloyl-ACP methyl ester carboxylesterase
MASRIRYARNGDVNIAYRTLGDGPRDLLFVAGTITNLDVMWEDAGYRRFCERLAAFSRLVTFDKRGMGLSERVEAGTMEDRMDDVRAILDAIGSERALIMGVSEGGLMAELFAASHPGRTEALILVGAEVREENDEEWKWGDGTREWFESMMSDWSDWGEGAGIEHLAPSLAGDAAAREWFGRLQLMAGNPRTIEAHMRVGIR